jgi:hypothetical protein
VKIAGRVPAAARGGATCNPPRSRCGRLPRRDRRLPRNGWAASRLSFRATASKACCKTRVPRQLASRPKAGSAAEARGTRERYSLSHRRDKRGCPAERQQRGHARAPKAAPSLAVRERGLSWANYRHSFRKRNPSLLASTAPNPAVGSEPNSQGCNRPKSGGAPTR